MRTVNSAHSQGKKCIKLAHVAKNSSLPKFQMLDMATVMVFF